MTYFVPTILSLDKLDFGYILNSFDTDDVFVLKSNYQVIMLSHASTGHNPIPMLSYNCIVILHCIMTSLTLCCLVMTLSMFLYSVVSKRLLLALSVFYLLCGRTMLAERTK